MDQVKSSPLGTTDVLEGVEEALASSDVSEAHLRGLLARSRDEVVALRELLARTREEAEQVGRAASHDLRAPARHLVIFLDLLKRELGDQLQGDAGAFLGHAVSASERLACLLDDMQVWSRAGRLPLAREPVDLQAMAQSLGRDLEDAWPDVSVSLTVLDLPTIIGTRMLVEWMVRELLDNAIRYRNGDAVRIVLHAEREEDHWRVQVSDDGRGIPEARLSSVLEPFTRLHAWDVCPGTGLGLAIASRVVERHGGSLGLEATGAGGLTAWFRWSAEAPEASL